MVAFRDAGLTVELIEFGRQPANQAEETVESSETSSKPQGVGPPFAGVMKMRDVLGELNRWGRSVSPARRPVMVPGRPASTTHPKSDRAAHTCASDINAVADRRYRSRFGSSATDRCRRARNPSPASDTKRAGYSTGARRRGASAQRAQRHALPKGSDQLADRSPRPGANLPPRSRPVADRCYRKRRAPATELGDGHIPPTTSSPTPTHHAFDSLPATTMGAVTALFAHPDEALAMLRYKLKAKRARRGQEQALAQRCDSDVGRAADWRFCYEYLTMVSRSFALVILELEQPLRDAVCVFYLTLRALDTIEDDTGVDAHQRMQLRAAAAVYPRAALLPRAGRGLSGDHHRHHAAHGRGHGAAHSRHRQRERGPVRHLLPLRGRTGGHRPERHVCGGRLRGARTVHRQQGRRRPVQLHGSLPAEDQHHPRLSGGRRGGTHVLAARGVEPLRRGAAAGGVGATAAPSAGGGVPQRHGDRRAAPRPRLHRLHLAGAHRFGVQFRGHPAGDGGGHAGAVLQQSAPVPGAPQVAPRPHRQVGAAGARPVRRDTHFCPVR
eukprot:ctg_269.g175